jgi:hypothetical protein
MASYTRDDLLALTPERYLAEGYVDPAGSARRELATVFATAASTQFLAGEVAPQELSLTAEAVRQILPLHDGAPSARAQAAAQEALALVANAIQQRNNEVLARWLQQCARAVRTEADLMAFLSHLLATERQYGPIAELSALPALPPPLPS